MGRGGCVLFGKLLVESLLLALAGSAAGLLLALWSLEALRSLGPGSIPRVNEISIDGPVLVFTLIVSVIVGLVFGLVPAIKTSRVNLNESLKEGSRAGASGPRQNRLRSLLVASEIALSLVLLIGAGLLIRSFIKLQQVSPGFRANNVLSMRIALTGPRYSGNNLDARRSFYNELWERIANLPGVDSVGGVSILPLSPGMSWGSIWADGYSSRSGETELQADQRIATMDYFKAAGIPLVQGRFFDQRDSKDAPKVAIIDETFARRFWPGVDPIGKRLKRGASDSERPWMTVVGVAGSVKQYALDTEPPRAAFYTPHLQEPSSTMYVVIHTASDPSAIVGAVRTQVRAIDAELPVYDVTTMDQRLADSLATRRFSMFLLGVFAAMALILAAVGTYGVMSYSITQRTHEIGIRMALGARAPDVLQLVVAQGIKMAGLGLAAGIVGALLLTHLMSSLLFGVTATDVLTFTVVPVVLAGVALAACFVPARRATRVDPMVALRYE